MKLQALDAILFLLLTIPNKQIKEEEAKPGIGRTLFFLTKGISEGKLSILR